MALTWQGKEKERKRERERMATPPLDDFMDMEDRDGVRMPWNVWPVTNAHEKKMVIPMGVIYSPYKKAPQPPPLLQYDPVPCKGPCHTVLNPFW